MSNERTGYNNLVISVACGLSTALREDQDGDLLRAERIRFSTQYPGGIHSDAEFFVKRDPDREWGFLGNDRLVIRNELEIAWEGTIGKIGYVAGAGAEQGRKVYGTGWWGTILQRRGLYKTWADNRVDENVWRVRANGQELKLNFDREDRLLMTPKSASFAASTGGTLDYFAYQGELVRRVSGTFDLQEQGQAWEVRMLDEAASTLTNRVTSGSATFNATLGTPASNIRFQFITNAVQTASGGGELYGAACNLMVYTETETISACVIANDVASALTSLNTDRSKIGSPGLTLEPFITFGHVMADTILMQAIEYGDSSGSAWAAYLDHSETAATPDGKPVLVVEIQPALTDYDYAIRLNEPNLEAPLEIVKDTDGIYNWIVAKYYDPRGFYVFWTPNDESTLTDATSVANWGQREYVLDARQATRAAAIDLGQRFLAQRKDPRFYVSGPVTVTGYIRGKNGNPVPSSLIRAGKRLRIEDFLSDEVNVSTAGLTFLITDTTYNDTDETCQISCGTPDKLGVLLAQLAAGRTVN